MKSSNIKKDSVGEIFLSYFFPFRDSKLLKD